MELRQLRYFVAIVECGSLSAASKAVHVAQPALSHHLKNLEAAFGKRLLTREARGIQPTREGDLLYRHAVGILRQADTLQAMLSHGGDAPGGRVAVGLPKTVSGLLSLPLFTHARQRFPAVALELVDGHSAELSRAVLDGRLDMAVIMPPGPLQGGVEQPLVSEDLVVICPQSAPWLAPGRSLTVAQLFALPMLISNRRERLHKVLESLGAQHQLGFNVQGHIDELGSLLQAVSAGYGVTVLPWCAVPDALSQRGLQARPLKGMKLTRELLLCRAQAVPLSDAALAVGQAMAHVLGELVGNGQWNSARLHGIDWEAMGSGLAFCPR